MTIVHIMHFRSLHFSKYVNTFSYFHFNCVSNSVCQFNRISNQPVMSILHISSTVYLKNSTVYLSLSKKPYFMRIKAYFT